MTKHEHDDSHAGPDAIAEPFTCKRCGETESLAGWDVDYQRRLVAAYLCAACLDAGEES